MQVVVITFCGGDKELVPVSSLVVVKMVVMKMGSLD